MSSDVVFRDPLAGALWRARLDATTIAPTDHTELTPERGERVAAELYRAIEAGGGRQVGWKIGAGDAAVRAVVRRDGEVVAEGAGAVSSAVATVLESLGEQHLASAPLVASGSLITPVPLQPGRHQVDFGQLGSLHLEVTA
jgi:2-keto-4-pentenoate hydratase